MKEDSGALLEERGGIRRHQSMQRLQHGEADEARAARVVPDHHGNLHITVKKTKPILGIAIEGGANTKHPLPRIINIHEHGAAYEAGGLEVGQLILAVDGHRMEGLQHQDVARLIAESFAQRDKPRGVLERQVLPPASRQHAVGRAGPLATACARAAR
ncbi:hypothetical protein B5X24_HaOG213239 [Helicoverpa armigera]|nr:hypothetical protein B5X24_HaOG213239 [Helicoverpa armigera]